MAAKKAVVERRPLLDVDDAVAYLGVPERMLRRLVAERRIAFIKTSNSGKGGRLMFDPDDLDAWRDACRVEARPTPSRRTIGRWS